MQDRQYLGARRILPTLGTTLALVFSTVAMAEDAKNKASDTPATVPLVAAQFIDKTYISLPKRAGAYALEKSKYDPERMDAGVHASYLLEDAPGHFTISLYVYPMGRAEEAQVVDAEIDEVEQAIRGRDDYSKIKAGPRTTFVVDAPAPSALPNDKNGREQRILMTSAVEKPPTDAASAAKEPSLSEALVDARAPTQSTGRRQGFTYEYKGLPVRSAGLVFYRHLYGIKLRISSPSDAMDQATFDALVDATARALVPKLDIRNFGQCGQMLVEMQASGEKDRDGHASALAILREQGRVARENCAESEGAKPDPIDGGYERTEMVFPPGAWR